MAHGGASTAQAGVGGPRAALPPLQSESVQQKEGLASWWRGFKRNDKKTQEQQHGTYRLYGRFCTQYTRLLSTGLRECWRVY